MVSSVAIFGSEKEGKRLQDDRIKSKFIFASFMVKNCGYKEACGSIITTAYSSESEFFAIFLMKSSINFDLPTPVCPTIRLCFPNSNLFSGK